MTVFPAPRELPLAPSLPDPFTFWDGSRVQRREDWPRRRHELALLAQHYEYGTLPPAPERVSAALEAGTLAITVADQGRRVSFNVRVSLPEGPGPFPAFLFVGAAPPAVQFVERGYAVLALKTNDIATDTQPSTGAFSTLYPGADTGMLMAWAWAMQRVIDAAAQLPSLDATRFAVNGFSRWGKAALLAGAFDERIALTVPSSSGLSGVGQYRYFYEDSADPKKANEKIGNAVNYAPHWFTPRFREFEHEVQRLPFDQHEIMALVAPRPLFMTVSNFDYWNNPRGSALSFRAAQKVFDYLGAKNNLGSSWDDAGHERTAKHTTDMLDFADVHLAGAPHGRSFQSLPAEFADEPAAHRWTQPET